MAALVAALGSYLLGDVAILGLGKLGMVGGLAAKAFKVRKFLKQFDVELTPEQAKKIEEATAKRNRAFGDIR